MSEHEHEAVEGVEAFSVVEDASELEDGGEDAEAKHAEFLLTYQPVITRLPEALADERAEQTAAEEAARQAEAQAQAERDAVEERKREVMEEAEAARRAYAEEHYPGTV